MGKIIPWPRAKRPAAEFEGRHAWAACSCTGTPEPFAPIILIESGRAVIDRLVCPHCEAIYPVVNGIIKKRRDA